MNWKVKAYSLAILSRMPRGAAAYALLQTLAGSHRKRPDEYLARAINLVELMYEAGGNPRGSTCLEIGTGWRPFVPLLLGLLGAERTITLDTNPWLREDYALETFRAVGARLSTIADRLGTDRADLQARYDESLHRVKDLRSLLEAFRIEYVYPGDARSTGLPDASVDVVCSSNVLEHLHPETLTAIHREALRVLQPSGLAVHRFNPGDHFSGSDRAITSSNFLRFSRSRWHWYGGGHLAYHNRLRCSQHRQLLEEAGFSIMVDRVRIDSSALQAVKDGSIPIHPDFARFTPEDLASDYMWLVGARSGMQQEL